MAGDTPFNATEPTSAESSRTAHQVGLKNRSDIVALLRWIDGQPTVSSLTSKVKTSISKAGKPSVPKAGETTHENKPKNAASGLVEYYLKSYRLHRESLRYFLRELFPQQSDFSIQPVEDDQYYMLLPRPLTMVHIP